MSIQTEKDNYSKKNAYQEVYIKSLRRYASIISFHHFFQINHGGEEGKLKLKFRLVPNVNRHKENDEVRKDSATAQFPIIRLVI